MSGLSIENIHKYYGTKAALAGVTFSVEQGEIMAVLGPSGSGKSTLLYVIAGLEQPDRGIVRWEGTSLTGIPPFRRGFGLMFQDFALFPHRNVLNNVAFSLQMDNQSKEAIRSRVREMLELVGLPGFEERDVNTLSGGEQQRVALARALAPHPRLLMLDEPLGSLDKNLRERLVVDLRNILHKMQQTAIYVTHDQEEAYSIADRVVIMDQGQIEQIGTPQEIYLHPASVFIARFLGFENVFPGKVFHQDGRAQVETPLGTFPVETTARGQVSVLIRPDAVYLNDNRGIILRGVVQESAFQGNLCRVVIKVKDTLLHFTFLSNQSLPEAGEEVTLSMDPQEAVHILPDDG